MCAQLHLPVSPSPVSPVGSSAPVASLGRIVDWPWLDGLGLVWVVWGDIVSWVWEGLGVLLGL